MSNRVTRVFLVLGLAAPATACAQQGTSRANAQAQDADVAARVGDRVITLRDVDEAWRKADPVEHARAAQMLFDGRKGTLDRLVADILIEQAAKAKGVAPDQYTKDEVAKRVKAVTEDAVTAFYEQNKAQMSARPLDQMRVMIRSYLEQQAHATARAALVAELRKAGPAIRVAIEPPRQKVDVAATDPARGASNAVVTLVEFSDYQ